MRKVVTMVDSGELAWRFEFHPPADQSVADLHQHVREMVGELAEHLNGVLPEGREKSVVFTKLEEAMMWANASVARNVNYDEYDVPDGFEPGDHVADAILFDLGDYRDCCSEFGEDE